MKNENHDVADIMNFLCFNVLLNSYALENVALGKLKPADKLPFDKFVEDLNLQEYKPYAAARKYIAGKFISIDEKIADMDEEEFIKECFTFRINFVFASAPKGKGDFGDDGLSLYKNGLNKYIWSLYPLFKEIIKTEADLAPFDDMPVFKERHEEALCYEKISKFLVTIITKDLPQGSCVEKYLKDISYIPLFVQRILKNDKNRRLLANGDKDSTDFKLAVLSAIHFMKFENTKLFEQKALKWYNKK